MLFCDTKQNGIQLRASNKLLSNILLELVRQQIQRHEVDTQSGGNHLEIMLNLSFQ